MIRSVLCLAVLCAFSQTGAASQYAISGGSKDVSKEVLPDDIVTVVTAGSGHTATVTGTEINIYHDGLINGAINASGDAKVYVGSAETNKVSSENTYRSGSNVGSVIGEGAYIEVRGQNLIFKNRTGDNIRFSGGHGVIGGEETQLISIQSGTNGSGIAVFPNNGRSNGIIDVTGKHIVVTGTNSGIWAQNNQTGADGPTAEINIDGDLIEITGGNHGIAAMSCGVVNINGNLVLKGADAILARGDAAVHINADSLESRSVQIEGDINFNYDADTSGTAVDADIVIHLSGANSYWNGNTYVSWDSEKPADESKLTVTRAGVTLSDNAAWNPTQTKRTDGQTYGGVEAIALNHLTLDGGIVNAAAEDQTVAVENLTVSEKGGTFNALATVDENGRLSSSRMQVASAETAAHSSLTVNYIGINADQITTENADELSAVTAKGLATTEVVEEGDINGKWVRSTSAVGEVTTVQADNIKLEAFKGVNASALVQWRNQINHLTKRLGDIRQQPNGIGAWARVYGGEYKWGHGNDVDMTSTSVQVGGDGRIGDWIVGGAFSYTDSSFDLDNGDGDGDLYSLAVYGTRMFDSGAYIDLVARYGYIKNDLQVKNMDVNFDSNAFSVSVESGHQFKFMERAYVEPQIEVTYGYAQGDDATASNGVKIDQDDYQNLVTRVGFRTGFDFPEDAGTIYAHVSYSYDFLGDADGTASKNGVRASLDQDLGGGWVTYGIGGQFKIGERAFAYADLERTTGGDVENPYAFNVGFRYVF